MKTVNSSKNVSFDSIYRKLMNEEKAVYEPFEYIEDLHDSIEIILNQYTKKYNTMKHDTTLTKYEMFILELSDTIQEAIQTSQEILEKSPEIDELSLLMNRIFSSGFGK
jgi:dsDNA-specific endonuclease/ATPase MutS2